MSKGSARKMTAAARDAGMEILRFLRRQPEGASFEALKAHCARAGLAHASDPTIRRGLDWLREVHDCPLSPDAATNTWILHDPEFSLPLDDPTPADLSAAIFARALIDPLVSSSVSARLERLVEEMDARVHSEAGQGAHPSPNAVAATVSTGTPVEPQLLAKLLDAITRRAVMRLQYYSPWSDAQHEHLVEPWQVRVHDGTMYLRAFSRGVEAPRNFRVVQIRSALVVEGETARQPRPPAAQLWGSEPGIGVDDDRPDEACLRIRGSFARWVALDRWDPRQADRWIEPGELLERRLPYRSCRELARRLLSLGDALVSVEPAALREEVRSAAERVARALA